LGIIALFIVLVYALAALVAVASKLEGSQLTIIVIFLVLFPLIVLAVFYRLVTKHTKLLYGPSDLGPDNFVQMHTARLAPAGNVERVESARLVTWLDADEKNRKLLTDWLIRKGLNISPTSFIYDPNYSKFHETAIADLNIPEKRQ
jgi:hypothetical protein